MQNILSAKPKVVLAKAFTTPYDNAIATARTCYSNRVITDDDVRKDDKAKALRDTIAQSTYQAGHHTTLQHAHFEFTFENVSRQALWSFFHSHPFYNSEQVSQRYVETKPDRVVIPQFNDSASQSRYEVAVHRQMAVYQKLLKLLDPAASDAYFNVYKARKKNADDPRWQSAIKKRCQEVARYVLPIGTHAHLYHTISGLTLHRYNRLAQSMECSVETRLIIEAMVNAVKEVDPLFFQYGEDVMPLEKTHEAQVFYQLDYEPYARRDVSSFIKEFDTALEGKTSKLINATPDAIFVMAQTIRHMFAWSKDQLSDDDALQLMLNPKKNPYLAESLNLNTLGKITRVMELVHFTFQKRISHSADAQAQRHRMTPGARPLLWTHVVPGNPDYITPILFEHPLAAEAKRVYDDEMKRIFDDIAYLADQKESPEGWQYLIPNSFPVRYIDTGSLLDHHHKWTARLCYNAQEEIWHSALDEVTQVEKMYPSLGKWLLPPCGLRAHGRATPVCPEGIRFCGTPVWRLPKTDYVREL